MTIDKEGPFQKGVTHACSARVAREGQLVLEVVFPILYFHFHFFFKRAFVLLI